MSVKVNEIFYSIDGEGKRAGYPSVFIRLTGCNLRCNYCDTEYAFTEGSTMSIDAVLEEVRPFECRNITLTGGEPLLQTNAISLIKSLSDFGYDVIIETNGSIDITEAMRYASICLDWKTDSSGENTKMLLDNIGKLRETDVIKIVMRDSDIESVNRFVESTNTKAPIYISPVYGEASLPKLVEIVKEHKDKKIRMQLQMHKFIWNPDERGV